MVLFVEVRPNLLSGESERFLLEDVSQVVFKINKFLIYLLGLLCALYLSLHSYTHMRITSQVEV